MRLFYFLRHGQTDWNVEGRMQGQTDIPLNETGIAQARAAADHYAAHPVDRIVSSPLQRAAVTARHVAERLSVPLSFDDRLMERGHGTIEKLTQAEIDAIGREKLCGPDAFIDWDGRHLPIGAEKLADVAARGKAAIFEYLEKHAGETILFVAHGAWFRALAYDLTGGQLVHCHNAVPYRCAPADPHWDVAVHTVSEPA